MWIFGSSKKEGLLLFVASLLAVDAKYFYHGTNTHKSFINGIRVPPVKRNMTQRQIMNCGGFDNAWDELVDGFYTFPDSCSALEFIRFSPGKAKTVLRIEIPDHHFQKYNIMDVRRECIGCIQLYSEKSCQPYLEADACTATASSYRNQIVYRKTQLVESTMRLDGWWSTEVLNGTMSADDFFTMHCGVGARYGDIPVEYNRNFL